MDAAAPGFEDLEIALADHIGVITLCRPPVNAMRIQTFEELEQALVRLQDHTECHVIILRSGLARAFCAGADTKEEPSGPDQLEKRQTTVRRTLDRLLHSPQPVVCALDGPVRGGGCALAACCDIRVASKRTTFAMPEIKGGRAGGARHLMRILPQGEVRLAYFTGRPVSASDAQRLGMVQILTADGGMATDNAARDVARAIAAQNPRVVRNAKVALDLAETMALPEGYQLEQQVTLRLQLMSQLAEQ